MNSPGSDAVSYISPEKCGAVLTCNTGRNTASQRKILSIMFPRGKDSRCSDSFIASMHQLKIVHMQMHQPMCILNVFLSPPQSLLSVHDAVAQRDFEPTLPPIPDDVLEEDDNSVKIVSLIKTKEPLGATIKRDESTGAIVVARIMRGGAADKSGLIHEGDELKEVNGVSLEYKKPKEILPLLARSQGEITFTVIPAFARTEVSSDKKKLFVRTLFDYDPKDDPTIPCKEAALAFKRGDVIQIVSKEEDTWWQACRHGNGNTWAGLIPSQQLQERRVALQRPKALFRPRPVKPTAGMRRSFRLGRRGSRARMAAQARRRSAGMDSLVRTPTYVEVVPYHRNPLDPHRLVVLVGPSSVGVNELKRRLLISDPERYSVTVPHTTREKRRQEKDGVDYHFVSFPVFEEDILNHRFIEYGRYRGHYYGTNLDSVLKMMAEGKVCLLDVHPNKIKHVYTFEFKPYVVFVKPPRIEELRLTRRRAKFICDEEEKKPEEDFEDMIGLAESMESRYGHLFDKVIVNGDIATAFRELRADLDELEKAEVHWIPAEWICSSPTRSHSDFTGWI
uniref:Membrane protein, palmitoylated 7b (MAGUK p55 subfamily member 7) n=1 Tax=Myripristis murdjan TaxID=586833 RepID=A0A667ZPC1_9TELE